MKTPELVSLLQDLVMAAGPSGQEEEVRKLCKNHLSGLCDKVTLDAAGNLIGHIQGGPGSKGAIRLMAHMDELSLICKRINDDGTLRVNPVGGLLPSDIGLGPVEILAGKKTLPGIISAKSIHTTEETKGRWRSQPKGDDKSRRWEEMHIFTGKSKKELEKAGVHAGTRVVVAKSRRKLEEVGPYLGGYFFDNRAAIAIGLCALSLLKKSKKTPKQDIYFCLTTEEEIGAHGSSYACRTLPGDVAIAIDVGPAAEEYDVELNANPIIVYQDSFTVYTKSLSDALQEAGKKAKVATQCATWSNYGSDASVPKRHGQTAQAGLLCIPTENTHGYEIIHREGLLNAAKLLSAFLRL